MSLLINGMEMPHCCVVCPFKEMYHDGLLCKATNPYKYIPKFLHKRYEKCPLVEVSTPHGRLIDADRLLAIIKSAAGDQISVPLAAVLGSIEHAPIVVEKEGQT